MPTHQDTTALFIRPAILVITAFHHKKAIFILLMAVNCLGAKARVKMANGSRDLVNTDTFI
jgi:hypothetical protein